MGDIQYAPMNIQNAWAWINLLEHVVREDIQSKVEPRQSLLNCHKMIVEIDIDIEYEKYDVAIEKMKKVAYNCKSAAFNGYIWYLSKCAELLGGNI